MDIARTQIAHAGEQGLPFTVVGADTGYGRDSGVRDEIAAKGKVFMVRIPCDLVGYVEEPQIGIPEKPPGQRGPRYRHEQVLNGVLPLPVREVAQHVVFESIAVRDWERGVLGDDHAFLEGGTLREEVRQAGAGKPLRGLRAVKELLVIRKDTPQKISYSLANAPRSTEKRTLAQGKANRDFVDRSIQDTKTEARWDELSSPKYRAYLHTLALDALVRWFGARMKLTMRPQDADSATVTERLGVHRLPDLSFANIRELLLTMFPLKTLSPEDAVELVTRHLVGRTKSTRSRLKGTILRI